MSKCRVWYHLDGKISVSYPDLRPEKKPEDLTFDEWLNKQLDNVAIKAPQFQGLDFEDMDNSQLPNGANPDDRSDRDRWRGTKATGIKIDNTVILRKDLFKQIDDELAKQNPGIIVIERLRRKLDRKEHD